MQKYYNTLNHNLKRDILRFVEKISKGLSLPKIKFVFCMIYGIMSSQSSMLSDIGRSLHEKTSLKKVIERLSRNLKTFNDREELFEGYVSAIKGIINEKTILIVDGSDITKNYTTKMEDIALVRDGSSGDYKMGYHTLGVTALTEDRKMPIPVYERVYSAKEKDFVSEDTEVLNSLKFLGKHFKKSNIRAFDRGYDNNRYYDYLIKNNEKFIIRAKKNRDVLYNGKKINIFTLANKFKGKYSLKFNKKNGIKADCKISIIPIRLFCRPNDELNLVVCYGFGETPLLLITNLKSDDNRLSVSVVKVYLMRWKIEEYYRFKKNQFSYENIRVRSLNSIRNFSVLLAIVVGYIALLSEKCETRVAVAQLIELSKRIYERLGFIFGIPENFV